MLDPKTGPTTTQNITLTPTMKRIEYHMQVYGIGLARTNPPKNRQKLLRPEAEKSLKKRKYFFIAQAMHFGDHLSRKKQK